MPAAAEADAAARLEAGRRFGVACLLFSAVGWGLNWPIIKLLMRDWPPLFARGSAGLLAAGALAAVAAARGERLAPPPGARWRLVWAALANVFAFMGASSVALLWLAPGEAALLVYTMPVWATLLAWPLLGTRPSGRALSALALCLAGAAVLLGGGIAIDGGKLPGAALALAGAVLFAAGTVTAPERLPMPRTAWTAWQVAIGCAPMIGLSLLFERPDPAALTPTGFAAWAYMIVAPMALCYLAWFEAGRRLSPPVAATGSLLVPVIGALAAAPIVGDPITSRDVVALALVLAGVGLVVVPPRRSRGPGAVS